LRKKANNLFCHSNPKGESDLRFALFRKPASGFGLQASVFIRGRQAAFVPEPAARSLKPHFAPVRPERLNENSLKKYHC
jgi:hypothetical protein